MFKSEFHENKDWNYCTKMSGFSAFKVQERVPRKQGLKHEKDLARDPRIQSSRASSTKTRIETDQTAHRSHCDKRFKSEFHENKDWNSDIGEKVLDYFEFKSEFHENKDWNNIS